MGGSGYVVWLFLAAHLTVSVVMSEKRYCIDVVRYHVDGVGTEILTWIGGHMLKDTG